MENKFYPIYSVLAIIIVAMVLMMCRTASRFVFSIQSFDLYTDEVTDITATSAHFYGAILEDGYSTITERGFVFSTMQYPTVDDQKVLIQTE